MALNTDVEHKSNLVVRIDQNSDSDLQALFDSVLKPDSKRPLQVPLRMRKLPDSFFTPPSTGSKSPSVSHSRDNSSDSTPGLTVSHPRAHSSPASLQQTYASAQQQVQHLKQRSYDVGLSAVEDIGPLPPGWEQARTPEGQVYYLNHITRTTTWEDPRKTLAAQVAQSQQQAAEQLIANGGSAATAASAQSVKGEGTLGNLPDGWEQAATTEGEVYFINHQTRTTSWFDPRIPVHLQRSPAGALLPQHSGSWLQQPLSSSQTLQACQQKLRLQSLQMERERLKLRQQEIMRQVKCGLAQDLMGLRGQSNTDLDPFLSSLTEHSRQESADSGLGLGNGYSLPHTPEDFLANMDDNMDGVSEGGNPSEMALDGPDMDNIDSTDDLVPSLQVSWKQLPWDKRWRELGEDFSNDILDDVQSLINPASIKPDNVLTWL